MHQRHAVKTHSKRNGMLFPQSKSIVVKHIVVTAHLFLQSFCNKAAEVTTQTVDRPETLWTNSTVVPRKT